MITSSVVLVLLNDYTPRACVGNFWKRVAAESFTNAIIDNIKKMLVMVDLQKPELVVGR